MTMRRRAGIFFLSAFGGFLLLGAALPEPANLIASLAWVFGCMIGQLFVLRCPHCRELAIITPKGFSTPFVGERCRHCGRRY